MSLMVCIYDPVVSIAIGNRPHPSSDQPPFSESDERRQLSMTSCDPRVHFTLVCGAKVRVGGARGVAKVIKKLAFLVCV